MRLNCTVARRDRQLASLAMLGKRATVSILSIGQRSGSNEVCIHHHSVTTKENTSYKVKGNILKVFSKYIEDGKTTISFNNPPHDLMINTEDKIQLKSFLNSLRLVLQGKQLSKGAGGLSSLDTSVKVHRPKTKLVITSKAEYPTLEGFPRTLIHLQVTGIERSNFDNRILKLHSLQILDLSNNKLKILPKALGDLPNLLELHVANNELGLAPQQLQTWDWLRGSHLPRKLCKLDLSFNGITVLSAFLRDCLALEYLKLDSNLLTVLPSGIGKMQSLRSLTVAHNNLQFLPGSMTKSHYSHLDLSHNPFTGECITTPRAIPQPLTLKELAARCVIAHMIPVSEAIIPYTVLRFMQGCDFCMCGLACFNPASSKIVTIDVRKFTSNLILGPGECRFKPFRLSFCVDRCIEKKLMNI